MIETQLAELLAAEDVERLAAAMEPGGACQACSSGRTCGPRHSRRRPGVRVAN